MTTNLANLATLKNLAEDYERLAGHQGYAYCFSPRGGTADHFAFGNGAVMTNIENALAYQGLLLDKVNGCEHSQIERFTNMPNYCRSCGAQGTAIEGL